MFLVNPYQVSSAAVVLYFENFDAAAVSGVPGAPSYKFPTGWTLPAGDPADPTSVEWQNFDDGGIAYPYSPGSGLRSLAFSNGGLLLESVTSEPFSTIGRASITVDFLEYKTTGAPAMVLEWSDDNAIWNVVAYTEVTDDNAWHTLTTVNLPAGVNNKATIYLRFSITGDASGNFTAIDDLEVRGV